MRRFLFVAVLLLPLAFIHSTVRMQEPESTLPNPVDFPPASATCKNRVKVSPWVGTPGVDWPKTFRCVLQIHTCGGVKEYKSGVRESGATMCADYWKVHNELGDREICCDCEKSAPWFGTPPSGCKDVQSPQITVNDAIVTLSLCGYPLFAYKHLMSGQPDRAGAEEYKADLMSHLKSRMGSRICCDRFREAVNSGVPCDPRADVDCDGKPNNSDLTPYRGVSLSVPDVNIFSRSEGAAIDPFPPGLDPDDSTFIPPADKCDCKWELVKGTLTCSSDGKQPHVYQARWRCPSTGNETFTRKEAPATAPCTPPRRAGL